MRLGQTVVLTGPNNCGMTLALQASALQASALQADRVERMQCASLDAPRRRPHFTPMTDARSARPRAFRLDGSGVAFAEEEGRRSRPVIEPQPDAYAAEAAPGLDPDEAAVEDAQKRGMTARKALTWGGLFWSATGALASLAIGVWFANLVEQLFVRSTALGWVGVGLLALAGLALAVLLAREIRSLFQQKRIAKLHADFAAARAADARESARVCVKTLAAMYVLRADTAQARARLDDLSREIIDGRDLIDIAERSFMQPLDEKARREIALAARRVSVVTAISPRALLDVIFVAAQTARLTRRIAEIYGGRPGLLGFLRIARSVGAHLAITGGMAVGDSLVQQVLGHGIAARLSARLGEGVLNGLLTARVGLSAMAVCRPMPFAAAPAPGVNDVAPFLFGAGKD